MSGLTYFEEVMLALAPKVTGLIGAVSSAIIIREILQTPREKSNPMLRALLGMSFFYMCDALSWFLSTWMAPEDLVDFAWSAGNISTCAFQGFWLQAVIAGPLYITVQAYYFYLVSVQACKMQQLLRLEKFMQTAVLLFALGTAILFLLDDQYNHSKWYIRTTINISVVEAFLYIPLLLCTQCFSFVTSCRFSITSYYLVGSVCWVNGSPPQCGHSTFQENPDVPCERGDYAWLYGMMMFYAPLWCCIVLLVYFNARIYCDADLSEGDAKWIRQQ